MIDIMSIYVKNFFAMILVGLAKCCMFKENANVLIAERSFQIGNNGRCDLICAGATA